MRLQPMGDLLEGRRVVLSQCAFSASAEVWGQAEIMSTWRHGSVKQSSAPGQQGRWLLSPRMVWWTRPRDRQ